VDSRIKDLDFLRGVAIIGVLLRHSDINNWFSYAGWAGVDLFFVLSGFLVSGLLFKEYINNNHQVKVVRFLIRRGFKIYPTFYTFLVISLLINFFLFHVSFQSKNILSEIFFLQSYIPGCYWHTWSLAIEEHFYLLVALLIFLLVSTNWLLMRTIIITFFILAIVSVSLMRAQYVFNIPADQPIRVFYSHLRIDGLFLGTLLAYLNFFVRGIENFIIRNTKTLRFVGAVLIAPIFIFDAGGIFMSTIGTNIIHLGFGIMVLLASKEALLSPLVRLYPFNWLKTITTKIGIYSYSIYVWHLFVKDLLERYFCSPPNGFLYLSVSIIIGIAMSLIIEQQILKFRDRKFKI
jgi:peptidoglycan/LPS O-acetylase OafA/YrhL